MNPILKTALALLVAGLALLPPTARAAELSDLMPVDEAYVLSAKAVSRERIEFTFKIAPGYYMYRHRFGVQPVDSGFKFNPLQIPPGKKHTDEFFGAVETYRQEVTLVQTGAAASGVDAIAFKVKFQGCADIGVCYPPQVRTLTVALPPEAQAGPAGTDLLAALGTKSAGVLGGDALPEEQAFKLEAIANTPTELLVRLTPAKGYYLYRDKTTFRVVSGEGVQAGAPRFPPAQSFHDEYFGDVQVWFEEAEIPLPLQRTQGAAQTITVEASFQGCLTDGICYPPMTRQLQVALPVADAAALAAGAKALGAVETPPARAAATGGLLAALFGALLGGLILNLMPCVLPVLSFKALGLAQASVSRSHARAHALWYTAGVLASFALVGALVLGLRGAGQALGWGFQLQQPWLVGSLALLMLGIGLALSGVVQFGASLAGAGQSLAARGGAAGDFFTGVLAVLVASPCTAPFMAGALGYAFVAPTAPAMLVFLALGLGLALPFLVIGFVPALAARLPKPGPWMESMKQWLAFPMYLTAVWLAWVFGKQRGVDALGLLLVAAVLLALALWWLERRRFRAGRLGALLPGLALALAITAVVVALKLPAPAARGAAVVEGTSVPYSAQALAQYRAEGRAVFVDMTADWCITCKVNEKAVFHTEEFQTLLKDTDTVYMVGDWTDQDAEISAFLDSFNSPGVPLYVVYPAGGGEGRRLPQLLSMSVMRGELGGVAR